LVGYRAAPNLSQTPFKENRHLNTPVPIPAAEIWLGVHRENRQVPRVRAVLDCLADAVRNRSALLNPSAAAPAQE
jgi:hypothetical protein